MLSEIIPKLEKVRASLISEAKKNRFKLETHDLANYIYERYLNIIYLLTTPITHQESIHERVADDRHNVYYSIFDKLLVRKSRKLFVNHPLLSSFLLNY